MILELKKAEYSKCRKLLNEQGQLEAIAVVEGINPGRIFVDNLNNPTSGLIWLGNNDGFIFFGNEQNERFNNELNPFIDNVIIPAAKKVHLTWFEAIGNHAKWDHIIANVFEHRTLGNWNQRVYTLQERDYKKHSEPVIEQSYKVIKLMIFFLKMVIIQSNILEFWSSIETFLSKGIGYCIIYQNEVVSICFSGFVVGNVHCIGIETLEAHQGKKLAQTIAHSFVKDCLKNNIVPYWDCMEMNKPSVAVAENLGFKNVFNYIGYEFSL